MHSMSFKIYILLSKEENPLAFFLISSSLAPRDANALNAACFSSLLQFTT